MSDKIFVKPAPGLQVFDPDDSRPRQPLPAEGAEVLRNTYWERRLKDGDVVASDAEPAESSTSVPKPAV